MKSGKTITLQCVYCEKPFDIEITFNNYEEIVQCPNPNCFKDSKVTIGDVNAIQEIYRGENKRKIIFTKKI